MSFSDELFSLAGKTAVVTGASRGIGHALASGLLRAGATVVLLDVDSQHLLSAVQSLRCQGLDAHSLVCDLSRPEQIDAVSDEIQGQFERLDILVNNAGVTFSHNMLHYPLDDWERTMQVNLRAPFLLVQRFATLMQDKGGSVINITSINAEQGFPSNPAYAAAKGGLKQLTKALAVDLGGYQIRVNSIGPGYIQTDMTAKSFGDPKSRDYRAQRTILGRWGKPDDVVGLVILLASDASSYITGQDIYVDGGWLTKGL